jgi:DNA polymerase/3'-5' exonuclease PolX
MATIQSVLSELTTIRDGYKSQGNIHKAKAYTTAIDSIRAFASGNLARVVTDADLRTISNLPGIGKAMLEKLAELIRTGGRLAQATATREDPTILALQQLEGVYGVGPVLANKLVRELGVTTVEQLRARTDLQTKNIQTGLRYYDDTQKKIPYEECETIARCISAVARGIDSRLRAICVGSHRRLADESGDIDILLTHPLSHSSQSYIYMDKVIEALRSGQGRLDVEIMQETLALGASKFNGFCRLANVRGALVRRIDIRFVGADLLPSLLLHFTGSATSNVKMRQVAIDNGGMRLNEWGLWRRRERDGAETETARPMGCPDGYELALQPTCEKDIFDALGLRYLAPKDRKDFSSHSTQ